MTDPTGAPGNPAAVAATSEDLASRVAKLAVLLGAEHYRTGDQASLKRWAPGRPVPLAFYRLWLRHLDDEPPSETASRDWMLIAWGLALMGKGAHRPDLPLGRAFAESGFSEARVERLLDAPDDIRAGLFVSMVRFLVSKDFAFNWVDAARLVLTRDPERRESIHRRIATDFYRHLPTDKE